MAGVEVGSAYITILPSAKGFSSKLQSQLGSQSAKAGKDAGDKAGKSFGAGIKSHAIAAGGVLAGAFAVDKVVGFFKDANAEARESQKVGALTSSVIKATGGAAGVTAKQVGDLSAAISNKTGIDDETIQSGANMLLTFKNIRNETGKGKDIFNQSTKVLTDMSAAMGTEPKQAAIQLGKALNDPVKGISALSRVGVTFTEKQKATIKSLVAGGKTAKAQKIILKELKSEFGGAAEAQATMGDKVKTAFANLKEAVGTALLPIIDTLLGKLNKILPKVIAFVAEAGPKLAAGLKQAGPVLKKIGDAIGRVFGFISDHGGATKVLIVGITGAVLGWKAATLAVSVATKAMAVAQGVAKVATVGWSVATKAAAAAQWLVNAAMSANPIGIVVIAIAALVAGFILAYKKSETFRKIVQTALGGVKAIAKTVADWFTQKFIPFFTKTIPGAFHKLIGWVKKNWPTILAIITGPIGLAVLAISKNWDKIKGFFSGAKKWVSGTWKKGWSGVKNWVGDSVGKGKDLAKKAWTGITDKFTSAKKWVGSTWKQGWDKAKGWIGDAVGKGRDTAKTALSNIQTNFGNLRDWGRDKFKAAWSHMKDYLHDPVGTAKEDIGKTKDKIRDVFNALDNFGRKIFGAKWDKIKAVLTAPATGALAVFRNLFGRGGKVRTIFDGFVTAAKGIFSKIAGAVEAPIVAVINGINHGLIRDGINWFLKKLHVKTLLDWIPTPKFDVGGWTGPGSKLKPAGIVHADEFVVKKASRRRFERNNPGVLDHVNRFGSLPQGYSEGGLVSFKGGRFTERFAQIVMALAKSVPGFQLYQGGWNAGGVAASGGTHDKDALDYGPANRANETAGRRLGLAAWLRNAATGWTQTLAHIHAVGSPSNSIGSPSARAQWQNYLDGSNGLVGNGRDTGNRSFVGKSGGGIGGFFGKAFDFLKGLSPFEWIKNKAASVAKGVVGGGVFGEGLMSSLPGTIVSKAKDWISATLGGGSSDLSAGVSGSAQAQIHQMMLKKWSESQWPALKELVQNESGWNPKATNSSSGAFGLFQALPASKIDKYGNRNTIAAQGNFGLNYIGDRYDSPAKALAAWKSRNPHWYAGGVESAAPGWAIVGENGPEAVRFKGGETVKSNKDTFASMQKPITFENCNFGANPKEVAVELRREQRRMNDAANLTGAL